MIWAIGRVVGCRSVQLGYIHRLFPVINSSTVEHEENSSDMLAEHQTYP